MSCRRSYPPVAPRKPLHISTRRRWIPKEGTENESRDDSTKVRIVSYNILYNAVEITKFLRHCERQALKWELRETTITNELLYYEADIILLQEISGKNATLLLERLKDQFIGIFVPKNSSCQGSTIMYRKNMLALKATDLIQLNAYKGNVVVPEELRERAEATNNIALVATFTLIQDTDDAEPLVVATPHLYWHPLRADVKLLQAITLMTELDKIVEKTVKVHEISKDQVHVVVAGDFNSLANSGVVTFLNEKQVGNDHGDFGGAFKDCAPAKFEHFSDVTSAYDGELMYTFLAKKFKGVIDYIFYSEKNLKLMKVIGPVSHHWLKYYEYCRFPNEEFPSDHFALGAEFVILKKASEDAEK